MSEVDVLIVGAGPAGATAALVLARAGVRVRLLDRARFPRPKLCGDTLNPGALELLTRLGVGADVLAAAVPLEGMTVTGPGGASVTGRYGPGAAGAAMARSEFDAILLRHALSAGSRLDEEVTVLGPLVDRARLPTVCGVEATAGGRHAELRARLTIAADGRRSKVAFGLGLAWHPNSPRRWAVGTYFEGVRDVGSVGEMHVRPRHYLGIAPLPGGLANVCLVLPEEEARRRGRSDRRAPGGPDAARTWGEALLAEAIARDPLLRDRFEGARPLSSPTVLGPLAVDAAREGPRGLLVAGDAAGFVDPMTGDGMRFALRSGELAAVEALRLLQQGPDEVPRLGRLLDAEFKRKRAFNRAIRRLAASPAAIAVAALAGRLRPGVVAWAVRYAGDSGCPPGVSRSTTPRAASPAA